MHLLQLHFKTGPIFSYCMEPSLLLWCVLEEDDSPCEPVTLSHARFFMKLSQILSTSHTCGMRSQFTSYLFPISSLLGYFSSFPLVDSIILLSLTNSIYWNSIFHAQSNEKEDDPEMCQRIEMCSIPGSHNYVNSNPKKNVLEAINKHNYFEMMKIYEIWIFHVTTWRTLSRTHWYFVWRGTRNRIHIEWQAPARM